MGTNRRTVGPTGGAQEENNLQAVIAAPGRIDPAQPYLARECGVARYERLRDAHFKSADEYQERTRAFWDIVRNDWKAAFAAHAVITCAGSSTRRATTSRCSSGRTRSRRSRGRWMPRPTAS